MSITDTILHSCRYVLNKTKHQPYTNPGRGEVYDITSVSNFLSVGASYPPIKLTVTIQFKLMCLELIY